MGNVLGVGVTALSAAQSGLMTTQHNIANVNTPGFHRQQILQSTSIPQLSGAGFIGSGVKVDTVVRQYNQFLETQLLKAQTQASYYNTYYAQVRQIDNMLADPTAGMAPALQGFFSGVQDLANNPASSAARQTLLSSAEALVARFQAQSRRLEEIRAGVNGQLSNIVTEINSYAEQIAGLNKQIVVSSSFAQSNQLPNDLYDQREQLIAELNKRVQVSTVAQADGSVNVFIGNGQSLVVGQNVSQLTASQSPTDPDNYMLSYGSGGTSYPMDERALTGGSLGGLLAFRKEILDPSQNALGRVAISLAQTFNSQHALGVDLNGALGTDFFTIGSTVPTIQIDSRNSGSGVMTGTLASNASSALTTSNYSLTYISATSSYRMVDLGTGASSMIAAASLSTAVPGLNLTLSGTPADGDSFLVMPTRYGARDVRTAITDANSIAAAAPVRTTVSSANAGNGTITAGSVATGVVLPTASVTMTYNAATQRFDLTSSDTNFNGVSAPSSGVYTSGNTLTVNGVSFRITGAPAGGDVFTIEPNYGSSFSAVSDNRNALALASLQTQNTMVANSSGVATTSYQGAYAQLVSLVGNKTREVEVTGKAQAGLVDQTAAMQQAFSGVNLDEEAANLLRYQHAYQAAGKMIQITDSLFQTLLTLGN